MEKIFDNEVVKFLKDTGVSEKEIRRLQFNTLKEKSINILETITKLIKEDKYEEIISFLEYSPAGDGYGSDNHFINFGDIVNLNVPMDINELIVLLNNLHSKNNK